jgi:hypothetical protein
MNAVVLAISIAYVVLAVLLLCMGLTSRFAWWIKGVVIVVTSVFFIESFFATKSLLGWPGSGQLPHRFQVLWTRVVEPDPKTHDAGAIFLWVEQVDDNNVPTGTPRSYQLGYSKPLEEKVLKARDEIMSGNPQEGTAQDIDENQTAAGNLANLPENANQTQNSTANNIDLTKIGALPEHMQNVVFNPMPRPLLPPKN